MVAVRGSGTGLSPADLERVRDTLAAGRKPKVMFMQSAGQVAGQTGQIVGLTDPDLSDEWVMVRFGRDELPFAPADLSFAPRPVSRKAGTVPNPREESSLSPSPKPAAPAAETPGPASVVASDPVVPSAPAVVDPVPGGAPVKATPSGREGSDGEIKQHKSSAGAGRSSRKAVRAKAPASLTVTLSYADGEWMVSATQGVKTLAKPYLVRPAEALRMVSMLDVTGVREAVDEIVNAAREEAQRRAELLRSELAEVEARLAELRDE